MIAFMPTIYEDELCYSWFARYYCHSGYPAYGYALDDLFGKRAIHFNAGYISSSFQDDAKGIITNMIPMETLILEHTMFPTARFMEHQRMQKALECMEREEGKASSLIPLPKGRDTRYLRYCPCCATEQRENFGEAFWTRTANINHASVCAKHRCKLKNTGIILSGKQSPRLHIAEQVIEDTEPEFTDNTIEVKFTEYLTKVFHAPVNKNNQIGISDFLKSKLEGTKYLSVSGQQRNIRLFYDDFMDFYRTIPDNSITELPQIQKIFTGYRFGFFEICQIAFFLHIEVSEMVAPVLPEKSQAEVFQEKVAFLRKEGFGAKKIAGILGADFHSVQKAGITKKKAGHDYSVRKGITREDWGKMDAEMLPKVGELCKNLYFNEDGKPGKVSVGAVCRILDFPNKRINYLPRCRSEIRKYGESQEVFWARKIVWSYRKLVSEGQGISYNRLCRPLNLRKENFISALGFLSLFCSEEEAACIREVL
ncbi:hypothetical protein D7V86_06190 [bacterium D16-51]|nr:hypothetical protein D7V96_06485 [bacterium D16-59]RKI61363.1 hypothetical protein D7V86_06190 [bacterium D16-51]